MVVESQNWGRVIVTRDESGLVIVAPAGRDAPPRTRGAAIDVCGGIVAVDVTAPELPPRAVLDDPEWAQAWLASVYGLDVAGAVAIADHAGTEAAVAATKDYLSDAISRLGVGLWLRRWWPAPVSDVPALDTRLLELELGGLTWLAEACFVETESAARLLAPHTEYLAEVVRSAQLHGTGEKGEFTSRVLGRALRGVVHAVDPQATGVDDCHELLRDFDARESQVGEAMRGFDAFLHSLAGSHGTGALAFAGALAASGEAGSPGLQVSTVDWLQVAPRVVTSVDDNVSWYAEPRDDHGTVLYVQVGRNDDGNDDGGAVLHARAYRDDVPVVFPLEPLGQVFIGTHEFDEDVSADDVRVDVCSLPLARAPRISDAGREAARLDREEVTGRIRDRIGVADAWDGDASDTLSPRAPFLVDLVAADVRRQS